MFKDFEVLMIEKVKTKNKRTTIIMVGKSGKVMQKIFIHLKSLEL